MAQQTLAAGDMAGGNGLTKTNDNFTDLYTNKLPITGGTITGGLTVDSPTFYVEPTNDEIFMGTTTRDASRYSRLFMRHDDHTKRGYSSVSLVSDAGAGIVRHPRPMSVWTDYRRTDAVGGGSESLSFGIHSVNYFGGNGVPVAATGSSHGFTSDVIMTGNGQDTNEHCSYFGVLRYEIGTGFTQSAGPAGRAWFTDYNVHGPVGVQPHLLCGVTMFMNNYYNGSPTDGPSGAYWATTCFGRGGAKTATHAAASTYPLDVGFGVVGRSGDSGAVTIRRGFQIGFKVGGYGTGWYTSGDGVPTRVGTGFEANDWEDFGVRIRNRISGATGPALAIDAANGAAIIGGTTLLNATDYLEVIGPDANADPLVTLGGTAFQRSYSMLMRNSAGTLKLSIAGGAGAFLTGTVAGDGAIHQTASGKMIHIGGTTKVVTVTQANTLGFHAATPIAKPTVSGAKGSNAALASLLTALASYGLVTDSTTA